MNQNSNKWTEQQKNRACHSLAILYKEASAGRSGTSSHLWIGETFCTVPHLWSGSRISGIRLAPNRMRLGLRALGVLFR